MKTLQTSVLLGALLAPFSAYAHPGQEGAVHWLMHVFAGVDPLWGGITGGVIMILGAWWIGRTPT